MKFTDTDRNVCVRKEERPDLCDIYFARSNILDTHNQMRQSELALEKKWITNNPYFRFKTMHDGVDCIESWLLSEHHGLFYKNSESDEDGTVAIPIRKKLSTCSPNNEICQQTLSNYKLRQYYYCN